ncbi:OmpA family protein [Flavobacterium sp. 25HG05S-40]|uniref:OmpA family protein n=1 Tax=Flavobacterium sp. 25HG05S-40 TaxID=3458682 RepID=UPI0040441E86
MQKLYLACILLFSIASLGQKKLEVFFDFNTDVPNASSQSKVDQWMAENKNVAVTKIYGYCDSVDDSKYNKELALRRVNTMLAYFKKENFKVDDNVELKSFGKDFKYSKNQSENRKVEIYYNEINVPNQTNAKETETNNINSDKDFELSSLASLVEEEKSTLKAKFVKAKVGDLIRIHNISFYFNSEKVMEQSEPLLDELLQIMLDNPTLTIQIHGHICCNPNPMDTKLSYRRALVILKYLTNRGIQVNRLGFKGFGSNNPIYKVPERNEKERAANRRVEILIVGKR